MLVDFRKGMGGLAAYVEQGLHADPFSGIVYVFRATNDQTNGRAEIRLTGHVKVLILAAGSMRLIKVAGWYEA